MLYGIEGVQHGGLFKNHFSLYWTFYVHPHLGEGKISYTVRIRIYEFIFGTKFISNKSGNSQIGTF